MTSYQEPAIDNFTGILKMDRRSRDFSQYQRKGYTDRLICIFKRPVAGRYETSILSKEEVCKLWLSYRNEDTQWKIELEDSFDGGCNFVFNTK